MNNLIVCALLLSIAILEVSAKCCGRGKHGYCNDCTKVGLLKRRKCCGSGSGHGYGCNVFCCHCGSCRKGTPHTVKLYGWVLGAKYSCTLLDNADEVNVDLDSLKDTWDAFNKIDQDGDATISPDEFLNAIKARLSDEEAHLLASDLLKSNNNDEIMSFLDRVNDSEMMEEDEDARDDIIRTIAEEFRKMDENGDELIQAAEFDSDLRA